MESSSSRCEADPTKAEPGRSVASLAPVATTVRAMRRQAKVWAGGYQPRNSQFQMSRRLASLKTEPKRRWGRQGRSRGRVAEDLDGVFDFGTQQEDGPGTWEALMLPRDETAYGEPE